MATTNASLGPDATPSKDQRPTRGRDTREGAHDDDGDESANNPPNHGRVTNAPGARFLEDADPERVRIEIGGVRELWLDWRRRHGLDTEQSDVTGWSE